MGKTVCTRIDNSGTVVIARKGYELKCPVSDCLLGSCNYVAVALNCKAYVVDIRRCSTDSAVAADALSKSNWCKFYEMVPGHDLNPRPVPRSFAMWLDHPEVDRNLGPKIVEELKTWGIKSLL